MAPHAAEDVLVGVTSAKMMTNGYTVHKEFTGPVHDFHYPPVVSPDTAYKVLDQYHSKPSKLRVACIGAGASGLCLGYKMGKQMVPDSWELTLFEKNHHFGGTWLENTYPGVACDVCPQRLLLEIMV